MFFHVKELFTGGMKAFKKELKNFPFHALLVAIVTNQNCCWSYIFEDMSCFVLSSKSSQIAQDVDQWRALTNLVNKPSCSVKCREVFFLNSRDTAFSVCLYHKLLHVKYSVMMTLFLGMFE
jgi:hypothetical protein